MSKARRDRRRATRRTQRGTQPDMEGMSAKQMRKAMNNIDTKEVSDVIEVIVRTPTMEYVLHKPEVTIMDMGQEIWSIVPDSVETRMPEQEIDESLEVKEADVQLITATTGVDEAAATTALKRSGGDVARAIASLK